MSQALLGNTREALAAIDKFERRMLDRAPAWIKQAWYLSRADILLLVGNDTEAWASARKAICTEELTVFDRGFTGAFARWLALTAKGTRREPAACSRLQQFRHEMTQFDAVDQVEVLCAQLLLSQGQQSENIATELCIRLKSLPAAISYQLRRLAVLNSIHYSVSDVALAEL
jgi:hypothetical protein